jgi:hypothetical protein
MYSATNEIWTPPDNYTLLSENVWADGDLPLGDSEDWYYFPVTSGTTYRIWWKDKYDEGTPAKDGDAVVAARYVGSTWLFGGDDWTEDGGWDTAQTITANQTGFVEVRVVPFNRMPSGTGTYGIVYSTGTTRPTP